MNIGIASSIISFHPFEIAVGSPRSAGAGFSHQPAASAWLTADGPNALCPESPAPTSYSINVHLSGDAVSPMGRAGTNGPFNARRRATGRRSPGRGSVRAGGRDRVEVSGLSCTGLGWAAGVGHTELSRRSARYLWGSAAHSADVRIQRCRTESAGWVERTSEP